MFPAGPYAEKPADAALDARRKSPTFPPHDGIPGKSRNRAALSFGYSIEWRDRTMEGDR
jgi:hypothetical protein